MKRTSIALGLIALFSAATSAAQQLPITHRSELLPPGVPQLGPNNRDWMAAHFINVGQGAATLLEFSCGVVLIDTGGGGEPGRFWTRQFANYLDGVFARRPDLNRTIDLLVLTHPHIDHTRGTEALIEQRYRLRHIVTNAQARGSGIEPQEALTEFAAANNIGVTQMRVSSAGPSGLTNASIDPLRCNGEAPEIRLLWGTADDPPRWPSTRDGNNHSVVVRVDFEESSFLVTGDLEEPAQRALIQRYAGNRPILNVDVYQVGHHGSRNGTIAELVTAMRPEMAVIGSGNPSDLETGFAAFEFGHPNRQAISALSSSDGVSRRRPRETVAVGVRGRAPSGTPGAEFEFREIDRAIFATGWDGDVVIFAHRDGQKRVLID